MKEICIPLKIIVLFIFFGSTSGLAQELSPFFDGKVIAVADGDTINVQIENGRQFWVRLRGVNAPEKQQRFGLESRQNLAKKVLGKQVRVEFRTTDPLGRVLGKVILEDEDVGLEQLYAGLGWLYTFFTNELSSEDSSLYNQAQEEARRTKKGLWKDTSPVSPWVYRTRHGIDEAAEMYRESSADSIGRIIGNRRSKLYYRSGCPGYKSVPARSRVSFANEGEAVRAGYRLAKSCR